MYLIKLRDFKSFLSYKKEALDIPEGYKVKRSRNERETLHMLNY